MMESTCQTIYWFYNPVCSRIVSMVLYGKHHVLRYVQNRLYGLHKTVCTRVHIYYGLREVVFVHAKVCTIVACVTYYHTCDLKDMCHNYIVSLRYICYL
jgi:hypothetical protein